MATEQGTFSVFKSFVNNNNSDSASTSLTETIQFGGDSKTYKELIYTSKVRKTLNLPISVLTNDSTTSRLAVRNRKKGTKVIPRPQNPWIIYRRNKYAGSEFGGIKSSEASIAIGESWRAESKEVVEYFVALSMLALENHQKKYGNYKYQPKQRNSRMYKKSKKHQSKPRENDENIPETMISLTEETTLNQDLVQLTVTPASPNQLPFTFQNGLLEQYLPTPASSSPLTFQDDENTYLPTPASSNGYSPLSFQDVEHSFLPTPPLSFQDEENFYLPTPASSNEHSPLSFQDENSCLPTPTHSNQQLDITLEDLMSIDPSVMYPRLSTITPTSDLSLVTSEDTMEFLFNADILAANPSTINAISTNPSSTINVFPTNMEDFELYSALTSSATPLTAETTTNMENQVHEQTMMYNLFEYDSYDAFSFNSTTPFMDQLDHYDNNGTLFQ